MKIVVTEGCVCDDVEIDGYSLQYMKPEEKREVLHKFIDNMPIDYAFNLFHKVIPMFGECEYLGSCDECGDSIHQYTWDSEDDMWNEEETTSEDMD